MAFPLTKSKEIDHAQIPFIIKYDPDRDDPKGYWHCRECGKIDMVYRLDGPPLFVHTRHCSSSGWRTFPSLSKKMVFILGPYWNKIVWGCSFEDSWCRNVRNVIIATKHAISGVKEKPTSSSFAP